MAETNDVQDTQVDENAEVSEVSQERPRAPLIESRFLFVDVAAMRAKQLRRGALPRIREEDLTAGGVPRPLPKKPERLAMEEVRHGLVLYETPDTGGTGTGESA